MVKFLRNTFLVLAVVLLASSMLPSGALATVQPEVPKLNLSHVSCLDDGTLEIHFVLLNVPDGVTPSSLIYNYGTIPVGKNTGNVWHYSDYVVSGYYDITSASVFVGDVKVTLHNPSEYAGDYQCTTPTEEPTETITPTDPPTEEPTETVTPTDPPTEEPTETVTPTEVTEVPTNVTKIPTDATLASLLPTTGANNSGNSKTLLMLGFASLGAGFILAGADKKIKNI